MWATVSEVYSLAAFQILKKNIKTYIFSLLKVSVTMLKDSLMLAILFLADFSDISISEVVYNRDLSHINGVSSGRPVDTWEWLKDGRVIEKNDYSFNQSQVISNYTAPTYVLSLSSEDMAVMQGRFTCLVTDSNGNTDRKTIMINSKNFIIKKPLNLTHYIQVVPRASMELWHLMGALCACHVQLTA